MLEEKNDNLLEADGNLENKAMKSYNLKQKF